MDRPTAHTAAQLARASRASAVQRGQGKGALKVVQVNSSLLLERGGQPGLRITSRVAKLSVLPHLPTLNVITHSVSKARGCR